MKRNLFLIAVLLITTNVLAGEFPLKMEMTSSAVKNGSALPEKFSCLQGDINPPLSIKNLPPKTKTLALTVVSPDAPEGIWVHWVVYNIPSNKTKIPENSIPGDQLFNDFGKFSYNGPCPADDKEHHFIFTVYAINEKIEVNEGGIIKDLEKAMRGHILAQASFTTTFKKMAI